MKKESTILERLLNEGHITPEEHKLLAMMKQHSLSTSKDGKVPPIGGGGGGPR